MSTTRKAPPQIAREALLVLAKRGLSPTPANFAALYHEIAGTPVGNGFPEAPLRDLAEKLPANREADRDHLEALDGAITRQNWKEVREALLAYCRGTRDNATEGGRPAATKTPRAKVLVEAATIAAFLRMLDGLLPMVEDEERRLTARLDEVKAAMQAGSEHDAETLSRIAALHDQSLAAAEEQLEVRGALLKLLRLILENIAHLAMDDRWLEGQIDALRPALDPPLRLRQLDAVERRLRDVMKRQAQSRERVLAARDEMRSMLSEFIDRLATIGAASDSHRTHLEACAVRIGEAKSIEDLAPLMKEVIDTTRTLAEETGKARAGMQALQERVRNSQAELDKLHRELDQASAQARHDPLTDTLNRKGLDESLDIEIGRTRRLGSRLSLAMLDLDDFKRLNDSRGHETGDAALVHLSQVAKK